MLGEDLLKVVEEVRRSIRVLPNFNSNFIDLIWKFDYPTDFGEFRLISLCNYVHKIIAKILAMRLNKLLLKVISLEQLGFLEGRNIHDVVGLVHNVFHSTKTKKQSSMVEKLDLSKAMIKFVGCI
jgi:hypothetical protein